MNSWAMQRKIIYITAFVVILFLIIGGVYYGFFHKAPNCFDKVQNADEQGIDCGGSCNLFCPHQNTEAIIHWSRAFEVSTSTYNLLAYVENPNLNAEATKAPYSFKVYDAKNTLLLEQDGTTFIPPGKIFGVFEGPITISSGTPKTVLFEFDTEHSVWQKATRTDTVLTSTRIRMTRERPSPRVDASLQNSALTDIRNVEAVAIIYDDNSNAVAASRTLVNLVPKEGSTDIVFTWPQPFIEQYASCKVPTDTALIIDRSGSMASAGKNPPEPLTSVKKAAASFVDVLSTSTDKVAVISFATLVSKDQGLGVSNTATKNVIGAISIKTKGTQETNIGDALKAAGEILSGAGTDPSRHKAAVLLTDGIPTNPTKAGNTDYPRQYAQAQSISLANNGIELFTIGLGKEIDETFLQSISANAKHYYKAPSPTDLDAIYNSIATALCQRNPVIEVIPRIYPTTP